MRNLNEFGLQKDRINWTQYYILYKKTLKICHEIKEMHFSRIILVIELFNHNPLLDKFY